MVVFTVTGDQGSSVARYLLKDGGYEVIGIARNPESDKAKGMFLLPMLPRADAARHLFLFGVPADSRDTALAKAGVKIAKGDLADPESYKSALQGAYGGYVNADCEYIGPLRYMFIA